MIETQGCYQGTGVFKPFYMVSKGSGKLHFKILPYANLFSPKHSDGPLGDQTQDPPIRNLPLYQLILEGERFWDKNITYINKL